MTQLLRHIVLLERAVGAFAPKGRFVQCNFDIYNALDLQKLARKMACFINMPFFTITVTFTRQKKSTAGHIEGHDPDSQNVFIEIDPDYIRHHDALLKVLAHEISHKYLEFHRLSLNSIMDNERLTDVTAIFLGFGTAALNGIKYTETGFKDIETKYTRTVTNGYLDLDESAFVHDIVCRMRGLNDASIFSGLNEEASESIKRVRKRYATCYPPNSLNLSPIEDKIAGVVSKLELVDLQLCNIDKVKILFSGALTSKKSEIASARNDVLKTRLALNQMKAEVTAPIAAVTYPSIPIWDEDVNALKELVDGHLATVTMLNEFVSRRVPPDVTSANWDALESIIIECPMCNGRLRLPTGRPRICVRCPKCKYAFDYSTTCPEFAWVPPSPFKECSCGDQHKSWLARKLLSLIGAIKRGFDSLCAR